MLTVQQVASDESIFQPGGLIVFPRSDGDKDFGPPNTVVPGPSESEINYFHVYAKDEDKHQRWRFTLGEKIAQHFGLPPLSSLRTKWKLHDFPTDYIFAEQRKGSRASYRVDAYLYGSHGHRFRSTLEVLDHFIWLLQDPSMNKANCTCKYCAPGGSRKPRPSADGRSINASPATPRVKKAAASAAATGGARRSRKPKDHNDMYQANSIFIRGIEMRTLIPSVSIPSAPSRDNEIMRELVLGQCEGFRVSEVVWYRLEQPVIDPTEPTRQIAQWPVLIEQPRLVTEVVPSLSSDSINPSHSSDRQHPSAHSDHATLVGKTLHKRAYQVRLLGTEEVGIVPESLLSPFLSGFLPQGMLESKLGTMEQHQWLHTPNTFPRLNILRKPDAGDPDYTKAIVAFAFAMQLTALLRGMYNLTDGYSIADTPTGVLNDLRVTLPPQTHATPSLPQLEKQQLPPPPTATATTSATGDGVPSPSRLSSTLGEGVTNRPQEEHVEKATLPQPPPAPPTNPIFYQGIYFGTERIWVGEVVRLKLSHAELKKLELELNAAIVREKPASAADPTPVFLDTDASYVLRVSSIYQDPKTPRSSHVAGQVYQIVTTIKYNAIQAEIKAKMEKQSQEEANLQSIGQDTVQATSAATGQAQKDIRAKLPEPSVLKAKPGYPAMPLLPQGFVLIPVTDQLDSKIPKEVSMPLTLIAGRIYPSHGATEDGPLVEEHMQLGPTDRKLAAREDTQDEVRARLSIAGLLSGCVKAMECTRLAPTRSDAFKAAFTIAKTDIYDMVKSYEEYYSGQDSDSQNVDELDDSQQDIKVHNAGDITTDVNSKATASTDDQPSTSMETTRIKSLKRTHDQGPEQEGRRGGDDNGAIGNDGGAFPSHASISISELINEPIPKKAKVETASQASPATGTTAGTNSDVSVSKTAVETPTRTITFTTLATDSPIQPAVTATTPDFNRLYQEKEGPLPPGWNARKSRTNGNIYFHHVPTKKTQWERPTV